MTHSLAYLLCPDFVFFVSLKYCICFDLAVRNTFFAEMRKIQSKVVWHITA